MEAPQRTVTADEMSAVLAGTNVKPREADRVRASVQWLLTEANEARHDVKKLFSFVMKEEHTGRPVRCMPHQRVLFDFIDAHPMCVVRMPVGSSKTFCMATKTLQLLGNDPTARGAIISATQGQAGKPLGMVRIAAQAGFD